VGVFLGGTTGLADGLRNFASLAGTESDLTIFIPDDNESGEGETTSPLHNFGNAVNCDDPFFEFCGGSGIVQVVTS
jgi:hypothetical protein